MLRPPAPYFRYFREIGGPSGSRLISSSICSKDVRGAEIEARSASVGRGPLLKQPHLPIDRRSLERRVIQRRVGLIEFVLPPKHLEGLSDLFRHRALATHPFARRRIVQFPAARAAE